MKIENLNVIKQFITTLLEGLMNEPEKTFEDFKEKWPKLSEDERQIISKIIEGIILYNPNDENLKTYDDMITSKIYWLAIAQLCEKPVENGEFIEDEFPKLKLAEGVKLNQMCLLFMQLKEEGYITSSYDLIAEALSMIFNIKQTTAYNNMSQSKKRLIKTDSILNIKKR